MLEHLNLISFAQFYFSFDDIINLFLDKFEFDGTTSFV